MNEGKPEKCDQTGIFIDKSLLMGALFGTEKIWLGYNWAACWPCFPMCEYRTDVSFCSTVAPGLSYQVHVRNKIVDATYMTVEVPSMRVPPFPVAAGISIVPPNDLPKVSQPRAEYVVIGAGKTGMDAVLFLLNQGMDPDHITWIVSNDAWLLARVSIYPDRLVDVLEKQLACFAAANTLEELYSSMEAKDMLLRLDPNIWPTKFRCPTVNQEELRQLRQIENMVRLGRVERIESDTIVLAKGASPPIPSGCMWTARQTDCRGGLRCRSSAAT